MLLKKRLKERFSHHESIGADPLVEDASHNEQLQWGAPEVVKKYDCLVKPAQELDANIARIAHGVTFCFLLEDDNEC